MARRVRDRDLESKAARSKLPVQDKPHYRLIERGLHLGYRRRRGDGGGTWEARHYLGHERYRREKLGVADDQSDADGTAVLDFWQAQDKARERMAALVQTSAGKTGPLTVDDVMADYLAFVEHERKDFVNAKSRVDNFILPTFGGREAASLTLDEIRAWHRKLATTSARVRSSKKPGAKLKTKGPLEGEEAKRKRKASANRILTVLKAALNMAFNDKKLADDRAWRRVKPFRGVEQARIQFLTNAEAKRLINACAPDFRKLVQVALYSGCRYGELTRLKVEDFHPGQPARGNRKAVAATLAIRESKTTTSRHVRLNAEGASLCAQICAGRSPGEIMLKRGDREWRASEQDQPMEDACARAKVADMGINALRHTYASLAIMNGTPLLVVARNLGHKDTRMVESHYGHLTRDYESQQIEAGTPKFGFKADPKVVTFGEVAK